MKMATDKKIKIKKRENRSIFRTSPMRVGVPKYLGISNIVRAKANKRLNKHQTAETSRFNILIPMRLIAGVIMLNIANEYIGRSGSNSNESNPNCIYIPHIFSSSSLQEGTIV